MIIYVFDDVRGIGKQFAKVAQHRGHEVTFEVTPDVKAGFVRTVNYGPQREECLSVLDRLDRCHIPCVPGYGTSFIYDDKIRQRRYLRPWLPHTEVLYNIEDAGSAAVDMGYPLISKSAIGSGSANVRFLCNHQEFIAEADKVFSPGGMKIKGGVQEDYMYLQQFIAGNTHDIRVCVTGSRMFGLIRQNRKDVPFASGSGKTSPIVKHSKYTIECFNLAARIAKTLRRPWVCFDFVKSIRGHVYCLEISTSWTESSYAHAAAFDTKTLQPTGELGNDWPQFALDYLESQVR